MYIYIDIYIFIYISNGLGLTILRTLFSSLFLSLETNKVPFLLRIVWFFEFPIISEPIMKGSSRYFKAPLKSLSLFVAIVALCTIFLICVAVPCCGIHMLDLTIAARLINCFRRPSVFSHLLILCRNHAVDIFPAQVA